MAAPDKPADELAVIADSSANGVANPSPEPGTTQQPDENATRSRAMPRRISTSPLGAKARSPVSKTLTPRSSRDASPVRPTPPPAATGNPDNRPPHNRSRKNSQDLSPSPNRAANVASQPIRDIPSAAAVQRALSATGIPRLTPESSSESARARAARTTPAAPNAPDTSRVKSPHRSAPTSRASSAPRQREPTAAPPSLTVEEPPKAEEQSEDAKEDISSDSGVRSPTRLTFGGTLEAVRESTLPETPAIGGVTSPPAEPPRTDQELNPISVDLSKDNIKTVLSAESESEGSGTQKLSPVDAPGDAAKQSLAETVNAPAANKTAALQPKKSLSQMSTSSNRSKGGDASQRNMTVETVTVNSLPQLAVSGTNTDRGGNRTDPGGTLRVKPSNETIRAKKDKKKTTRKAAPVAGASSTKADIFEARVASAVDEADSSDSGETFVYESNPPEPPSRPGSRFHHSRTPSAQSAVSQVDHHGRVRGDGHNSILGKKSMKFTNSLHNVSDYGDGAETSQGGSSTAGAANGTHRSGAHHIGRHGRPPGQVSILGGDAPFVSTPTRMRAAGGGGNSSGRHGLRTPREGQFGQRTPNSTKSPKFQDYDRDVDDDDDDDDDRGADDERTPLFNSGHSPRATHARHSRRPGARYRGNGGGGGARGRSEHSGSPGMRGIFGWVLLGALVATLVAAVVTALVLCSKPLHDVKIGEISNVVASEEELLFDLRMFATNPNLVAIQIDQLNMKIFARSKHVGSTAKSGHFAARDNVDEGTDPIADPDDPGGTDTMMLGHVYALDSPLTFAPSPFAHHISSDLGELSIEKPGNKTADNGTERWKTVVQHPFELLVVGQLKYQLPISAKWHSVSVGRGSANYTPNEPVPTPSPSPSPQPPKNGTNGTVERPWMPGPVKEKGGTVRLVFVG